MKHGTYRGLASVALLIQSILFTQLAFGTGSPVKRITSRNYISVATSTGNVFYRQDGAGGYTTVAPMWVYVYYEEYGNTRRLVIPVEGTATYCYGDDGASCRSAQYDARVRVDRIKEKLRSVQKGRTTMVAQILGDLVLSDGSCVDRASVEFTRCDEPGISSAISEASIPPRFDYDYGDDGFFRPYNRNDRCLPNDPNCDD